MIEDILTGDTLKERFKNFNDLISGVSSEEFTDEYIENLSTTKSPLDQLFLAELANRFKNPHVVCHLLKSEDGAVVSKILKCDWFFDANLNKDMVNPDFFFNNIFPYTSYATTCKIISRMKIHQNDEKVAERFYERICDKYGCDAALRILSTCSENFIIDKLKTEKLRVSGYQLMSIYKKFPYIILDNIDRVDIHKHPGLLKKITCDYPEKFFDVFEKYPDGSYPNFGYKTTLKLLDVNSDLIIRESRKFIVFLNREALLKKLKGDDRDRFVKNCFPIKRKDFYYTGNLDRLFGRLKKDYAVEYFIRIFETVYGVSAVDANEFPAYLAKDLPLDLRCEFAKKMLEKKKITERQFIEFDRTENAIKLGMELINNSNNSYERGTFLESMIESCRVNKDNEALLQVLKYVLKRHRNDNKYLICNLLRCIKNGFALRDLSDEHWKIIEELLKILICSNDIYYHDTQLIFDILKENLYFRLENDREIESILDIFLKYNADNYNLLTEHPEYQNKILDAFYEKCEKILKSDTNNENKIIALVKGLGFNRSIDDYPWLIEAIKYYSGDHLAYFLNNKPETRNMFPAEILKGSGHDGFVHNALLFNTNFLCDNVDLLIEKSTVGRNPKSFRLIRTFLGKPLKESLIERLNDDAKSLVLLSHLMDGEEYEDVLRSHMPSRTKIDPDLNISLNEMDKAVVLLKNLRWINPPLSFDVLSSYAKEDYLKHSLNSLLYMCIKKPEGDTLTYLGKISKGPVSIKKHAIRLYYLIYPRGDLLTLYSEMWKDERNNSVRSVLFDRTLNVLKREVDSELISHAFTLVKDWMKEIRPSDLILFRYLHTVEMIPEELLKEYCESSWSVIKRLEGSGLKVNSCKAKLTNKICPKLDVIGEDFCRVLIQEYFALLGVSDDDDFRALTEFCTIYLFKSTPERIHEFCAIFKDVISTKWNMIDHRKAIVGLFDVIITKSLKMKLSNVVLIDLYNVLKSTLPFKVLPVTSLKLSLVISYIEYVNREDFVERFALCIKHQFDNLITLYTVESKPLFVQALKYFNTLIQDDEFLMNLVKNMLSLPDKTRAFMLLLLDFVRIENDEEILEEMWKFDDEVFRMALANEIEKSSFRLLPCWFNDDADDEAGDWKLLHITKDTSKEENS